MLFPPAAALIAPLIAINSISSGIGVCAFFALIAITAFLPTIGLSRAQRSASDELSELQNPVSTSPTHSNNEESQLHVPSEPIKINNEKTISSNPSTKRSSIFQLNDQSHQTLPHNTNTSQLSRSSI
jgi:hypothetical protein